MSDFKNNWTDNAAFAKEEIASTTRKLNHVIEKAAQASALAMSEAARKAKNVVTEAAETAKEIAESVGDKAVQAAERAKGAK
jgi:hypothetical protein